MQAGFAMVETGLTRAKNAGNIIKKNLMDQIYECRTFERDSGLRYYRTARFHELFKHLVLDREAAFL